MIEIVFKEELHNLGMSSETSGLMWQDVEKRYAAKGRHYHTIHHLDHMLAQLRLHQQKANDWQTLIFSLVYHDAVYNPLRSDNEEKSAALAMDRLSSTSLSPEKLEACKQMILATKKHLLSDNPDTNLFIDADLSILGSAPGDYDQYVTQIRKEYRYYPDLIYKPGRQKVLSHFLSMPRIFKTRSFFQRFESQARENLHRELSKLLAHGT